MTHMVYAHSDYVDSIGRNLNGGRVARNWI